MLCVLKWLLSRLNYLRNSYIDKEYLRSVQGLTKYRPIGTVSGINHQRRPDLYAKLVEPQPDAYDYFYYKRGLDSWQEEYKKVRREGKET